MLVGERVHRVVGSVTRACRTDLWSLMATGVGRAFPLRTLA
jgi:hypothetical protein